MSAYPRPTYSELMARIEADLAALPAVLRGPLSAAWAQACHSQHGHLEWVDAQCSPLTCELERLTDWAGLYGVVRLTATAATGTALASGTAGSSILAATLLRGQNGQDYEALAAVVLGAGQTPVSVRCTAQGAAGNLAAGLSLSLVDPVPGVANTLTVGVAGLTGGAEEEALEDWRIRVADEWQTVVTRGARSGKPEDYRFWAKTAHPSVSGALIQPHALGLGTVIVRPICNGLASRAPTQAVLDAVTAYLALVAPATADVRVTAPLPHPVSVSVHLAPAVDTAGNRAAIISALFSAVEAEMSDGAVLALAEIDAAIASITTQYTRLAPMADVAVSAGEILVWDGALFS